MSERLVTPEEFDQWSAAQKKARGWRAGLYWSRTNTGGWAFSRHWPHLLCWSWSLWISPHRTGFDGKRRFFWLSLWQAKDPHGRVGLKLLWLGEISLSWQPEQRMSALGLADRPKVDWETERACEFWSDVVGPALKRSDAP
jgi:hypothetical protein